MAAFNHFDLALLNPAFDSPPLVDVLTDLEHLRRLQPKGSTVAPVFFQLKRIFQMLESLGSAHIEGNHTTLVDYLESSLEGSAAKGDQLREVANIEVAMTFIETSMEAGLASLSQTILPVNSNRLLETVHWPRPADLGLAPA